MCNVLIVLYYLFYYLRALGRTVHIGHIKPSAGAADRNRLVFSRLTNVPAIRNSHSMQPLVFQKNRVVIPRGSPHDLEY